MGDNIHISAPENEALRLLLKSNWQMKMPRPRPTRRQGKAGKEGEVVEVYKAECREILRRYRAGKITRDACINMLDAAIAGILPTLTPEQLAQLRDSQLYKSWNHRLIDLTTQR